MTDRPDNGVKHGLFREITETKERAAAWIFRGAMGLMTAAFTFIGAYIIADFNNFRADLKEQNKTVWEAISSVNRATASNTNALATLAASHADHVKEDERVEAQFATELLDHETRIRTLERPQSHRIYPH